MKIIDLTLPIYSGMPVYPGDPGVEIKQLQTLEKDGWNMKRIHINGHDGTHVNVPLHCKKDGKSLDDYNIQDFCGECVLYTSHQDLRLDQGAIFAQQITMELAQVIVEKHLRFIGLSSEFEINEDVEKFLLQNDILCFERLANTGKLPSKFFFHGAPLKIKQGDGSPVRAYAIC